MLWGDAPHLKVHANGIEDRQVAGALVGIAIGFDAYVHPVQGDMVLPGESFDHIHGAGRYTGEKQFTRATASLPTSSETK